MSVQVDLVREGDGELIASIEVTDKDWALICASVRADGTTVEEWFRHAITTYLVAHGVNRGIDIDPST